MVIVDPVLRSSSPLCVAYCIDRQFLRPLLASLTSLVANRNKERDVEIFILSNGLKARHQKMIQEQIKGFDRVRCTILEASAFLHSDLPWVTSANVTKSCYLRLALADFLPKEIDRVVYLDADTIVVDSLDELWETDLRGKLLAAVDAWLSSECERLGIDLRFAYFNSGVLLMDLKRWRKMDTWTLLRDFIIQSPQKIKYWDQDVLNAVLHKERLRLHPRWNCTLPMFTSSAENTFFTDEELLEATSKPAIVHYITPQKPWKAWQNPPQRELYLHYDRQTPYRGKLQRLPPLPLRRVIQKLGLNEWWR